MSTIAAVLCTVVALLHLLFMYLEMFRWRQMGRGFGMSREEVAATRVLAANQGIYNGAVAGVLAWATFTGNVPAALAMLVFVIVVGVYGGLTVNRRILMIQAAPAVLAAAFVGLG